MEILRGVTFHQKKSAVSLGKFDGIHLGHQLLMNEIKSKKIWSQQYLRLKG